MENKFICLKMYVTKCSAESEYGCQNIYFIQLLDEIFVLGKKTCQIAGVFIIKSTVGICAFACADVTQQESEGETAQEETELINNNGKMAIPRVNGH